MLLAKPARGDPPVGMALGERRGGSLGLVVAGEQREAGWAASRESRDACAGEREQRRQHLPDLGHEPCSGAFEIVAARQQVVDQNRKIAVEIRDVHRLGRGGKLLRTERRIDGRGGKRDPRIGQHHRARREAAHIGNLLAPSGNQRRLAGEADVHVGAELPRQRGEVGLSELAGIGALDQPQGSRRVGRAAAETRSDGKLLDQPEMAEPDPWLQRARGHCRGEDQIVAAKRPGKRAGGAKAEIARRLKLYGVACPSESDQAYELVVAVLAPAEHLQGEIDLGPSKVAQRR